MVSYASILPNGRIVGGGTMEGEKIARYLADNLILLRRKRGLSQDQLARLAEIPRSTLTHMESGSGNPSLQNLIKLSAALQISIEEILARPRNECEMFEEGDLPIQRRSQGRALVYKLLPETIRGLQVDKMELESGVTMAGHPHTTGAKEYLTVIQGEITVGVAGEHYLVKRGTVFAFPGDQPHAYRNSGTSKALGISIIVPVTI
jgi:XRE family transcriptional regulator, regulator of sulfur utilization